MVVTFCMSDGPGLTEILQPVREKQEREEAKMAAATATTAKRAATTA